MRSENNTTELEPGYGIGTQLFNNVHQISSNQSSLSVVLRSITVKRSLNFEYATMFVNIG